MRILLVDDNQDNLRSLAVVLDDLGHETVAVVSGEEALQRTRRDNFPLVITDIRMPGLDGLELLSRIKEEEATARTDVVIITGHGDMETAVEALRRGAYDYLNKPINARELAAVVERSAEHQRLLSENTEFRLHFDSRLQEATAKVRKDLERAQSRLRANAGIGPVVAESQAMLRLLRDAHMYHQDPTVPVLIEGETGVGKEVFAKLIHYGDGTTDSPFVAINCSAIPHHLFEGELFGHEPGAYTGSAPKGQAGKLELAANGSLFLDEVAETDIQVQPKLLRVLEDRTFYRLGGLRKRDFNARIICAANSSLAGMVESGRFRRDLFHRLKVGHLIIPPLRERVEDIPPLIAMFLHRESKRKKKNFKKVHPETMEILQQYSWPGNIRELENVIERAVLTCDGEILLPEHIAFLDREHPAGPDLFPATGTVKPTFQLDFSTLELPEGNLDLEELNLAIIHKSLEKFSGNKSLAARYLGISRYALLRRLQKKQ